MIKNKNPFFSVLIPTYNHGHLIRKCLDSVLAQTYTNWEVIVVNNFSTDNTEEVVHSYHDKRIKLINFSNNGVIAKSRNRAIEEAKGEWLCFLDSDDWWTSDKLSSCLKYMDNNDLIYHSLRVVSENGEGKKLKLRQINPSHFIDDFFTRGNPIPNSSVVLRKSIQEKIGLINDDKGLIGVEDADYWLRISSVTKNIYYINRCLGYYWVGENTSYSIKQLEREKKLYDLYWKKISIKYLNKSQTFLLFSCARILHLNRNEEAIEYYLKVLKGSKDILYIMKSIIGIFLMKINK